MFISSSRFILKTCGTTTPLLCLPLLMSMVQEYSGFDNVQDLFYSRKNFKRPELQRTPHRSFQEEAEILNQFFPGKGGRAYCLGSFNGDDCWYLYYFSAASIKRKLMARQNLPSNRSIKSKNENDQTLEVLMTGVDPKKMVNFYKENCPSASEATKVSGIGNLIPGMTIDDFLFDPCGYSMNGVSKTVPGGYMTIHVTPEPEFSYVSFETNIHHKNYKDLIKRVVKLFGPKQFVVTFFSSEGKPFIEFEEDQTERSYYDDYYVEDLQVCRLPGYDLTYALFNRFPS
ncbi:S-adenosylmethionine decarboxylase proenzyme [Armadillidium nasatum]|uniref:S-adenosylmethionine decarboxylase proenzyme n=2 Tax=Armadillidium nasatum TaxID=96803 RepID=A0A5N5STY4_9CRUS|nr:S-adenosylmethionine decarboxylase proenzyme [Armadillidium nasatum]